MASGSRPGTGAQTTAYNAAVALFLAPSMALLTAERDSSFLLRVSSYRQLRARVHGRPSSLVLARRAASDAARPASHQANADYLPLLVENVDPLSPSFFPFLLTCTVVVI